jgi:hypothetical protein
MVKVFFYEYLSPTTFTLEILVSKTPGLTQYSGLLQSGETATDLRVFYVGDTVMSERLLSQNLPGPFNIQPSPHILYQLGAGDSTIPVRTVMLSSGDISGQAFFFETTASPEPGTSVELVTTGEKKFNGGQDNITLSQNGIIVGLVVDATTGEWSPIKSINSSSITMAHKTKPVISTYIVGAYFSETGFFTPSTSSDFVPFNAPASGWTPGMPATPDIATHPSDPSKFVYIGARPKFFHVCAITNIEIKTDSPSNFMNIEYLWKKNGAGFGNVRKQSLTAAVPFIINAGNGVAVLFPGDEIEATYRITDASTPTPQINFVSNTFSITEFLNYFEN